MSGVCLETTARHLVGGGGVRRLLSLAVQLELFLPPHPPLPPAPLPLSPGVAILLAAPTQGAWTLLLV